MTYVSLSPSSTVANSGAVTGSSAHAALSDSSDATYVDFSYGQLAQFELTDLSLPSGAELVFAQAMVRVRKDGDGPGSLVSTVIADRTQSSTTAVTWETTTEVGGATVMGGLTDAGLDGATLGVGCLSLSVLRIYKAWVRVCYITKPTVTVNSPSGTIAVNKPSVSFTPTFDVHAQTSSFWRRVRVFSQAQYSAGGFNPETSTATLDSGVRSSADSSWLDLSAPRLADGNYRAYVKVAASNMPDQWSDWAYSSFVVDAPEPGVPALTVTADNALGRIKLDLDDTSGDVTTNYFEVQRSTDGVNFTPVRVSLPNGLIFTSGSPVTLYDYEAPNGVNVTYRARAFNFSNATWSGYASDTAKWESRDEWLKCLLNPSRNLKLTFKSYPGFDAPANQTVFRPLGASKGIAVQDIPGPAQGQLVVFTKSETDRVNLRALLAEGSPVLLQVPGTPDRVVALGDRGSTRIVDNAGEQWHEETLSWTEVENPDAPLSS